MASVRLKRESFATAIQAGPWFAVATCTLSIAKELIESRRVREHSTKWPIFLSQVELDISGHTRALIYSTRALHRSCTTTYQTVMLNLSNGVRSKFVLFGIYTFSSMCSVYSIRSRSFIFPLLLNLACRSAILPAFMTTMSPLR